MKRINIQSIKDNLIIPGTFIIAASIGGIPAAFGIYYGGVPLAIGATLGGIPLAYFSDGASYSSPDTQNKMYGLLKDTITTVGSIFLWRFTSSSLYNIWTNNNSIVNDINKTCKQIPFIYSLSIPFTDNYKIGSGICWIHAKTTKLVASGLTLSSSMMLHDNFIKTTDEKNGLSDLNSNIEDFISTTPGKITLTFSSIPGLYFLNKKLVLMKEEVSFMSDYFNNKKFIEETKYLYKFASNQQINKQEQEAYNNGLIMHIWNKWISTEKLLCGELGCPSINKEIDLVVKSWQYLYYSATDREISKDQKSAFSELCHQPIDLFNAILLNEAIE